MKPQKIIVWHRRDLRVRDNKALLEASTQGYAMPVFVIDLFFFRENNETNPDRILFMLESLEDLNEQYKELGSSLKILFGNTLDKLEEISKKHDAKVYYNFDTNMNFGIERDIKAATLKNFKGFQNDAIIREGNSRNSWHKQCADYFESKILKPIKLEENKIKNEITTKEIIKKYNLKKEKISVPKGGTKAAKQRLKEFLENLDLYTKSISKPILSEKYTSRLSAHLSLGCISTREIYREANKINAKQKKFFITRLFWNQHFTQKMQDNPALTTKPVNPVFEENYDKIYEYNEEYINAWKQGKTGYPLVDASMRALVKTGFLNFRMRAMVASFFCYILRQNWKIGADFMHYHLIDADTAINYAQWQMQAGMVGIHPNRIYNPKKQIIDNDKNLEFIKKYVEELKDIPNKYILDSGKLQTTQTTLNQEINKELEELKQKISKYSAPIVNFEKQVKKAKKIYKKLNEKARKRLYEDKDILRKASLSGVAKKRYDKKEKTITKVV
ncbi:MAG: FAD-binding domain-containing protein [Candidatus Woesearchaeota archaeon]